MTYLYMVQSVCLCYCVSDRNDLQQNVLTRRDSRLSGQAMSSAFVNPMYSEELPEHSTGMGVFNPLYEGDKAAESFYADSLPPDAPFPPSEDMTYENAHDDNGYLELPPDDAPAPQAEAVPPNIQSENSVTSAKVSGDEEFERISFPNLNQAQREMFVTMALVIRIFMNYLINFLFSSLFIQHSRKLCLSSPPDS